MSTDRPAVSPSPSTRSPRLLDLIALSVGYSLAAALVRAFWPGTPALKTPEALILAGDYFWLGLAMSGPFVLLFDRREARRECPMPGGGRPSGPSYTRAECAWLLVGAYWIILTAIVVPTRLPRSAATGLTLLPIVFIVLVWLVRPATGGTIGCRSSWTNRAAILMLSTWPLAWGGMILLTTIWS